MQPSLVIVYFGGNDSMGAHPSGLGPHVPLPEYIENMRKIASHIQVLTLFTQIISAMMSYIDYSGVREALSEHTCWILM